ncbi:unnamed protein product [Dibothriocephalus latus]|uniref:CCDC43 PWI-like domain-containing protein n=1 Tax=Dibothriocephalus latus TaxID=60516 RepID=A0A3P7PBI6_DIBLA|nr:unnamed protein product [Dibothriocephalus latus]
MAAFDVHHCLSTEYVYACREALSLIFLKTISLIRYSLLPHVILITVCTQLGSRPFVGTPVPAMEFSDWLRDYLLGLSSNVDTVFVEYIHGLLQDNSMDNAEKLECISEFLSSVTVSRSLFH